jgi:hypothetical protein
MKEKIMTILSADKEAKTLDLTGMAGTEEK